MASGNLFLGNATKSVGDVTMYVRNGKQVSRVRRRTVANPRTGLQLAQRCILKTVSTAYSILAPICCQSFQGKQSRSMNQARFQKVNLNMLRTKAAAAVDGEGMTEAGVYENETGNFAGKSTMGAVLNPYVVSEGSLMFSQFKFYSEGYGVNATTAIADMTYQQFCDLLGVQAGDQLTFLGVFTDCSVNTSGEAPGAATINDFQYARIILMPSDGDMTSKLFSSAGGTNYTINKPNPRNEGAIIFFPDNSQSQTAIKINSFNGRDALAVGDEPIALTGAAVILSRQTNAGWQYSNTSIDLFNYDSDDVAISDMLPLNAAVASFESSQDSSKYLDQARRVG